MSCNCGCGGCETKIRGPLLTEGKVKVKSLLSEGLQYHIDKQIPLFETVYRIGSNKHLALIKEARKMYSRNVIDLCEEDEALIKTHLGEFGIYEGEAVPLDLPMLNEDLAKINAFVDKWEDKLKKVPVIGKLLSKGIDNLQGKVNTLIKTAQEEAGETREAMKIVARYMKGETVGKESNEFLKTQMKDLFKIGGAVAAAIGFPPAAVIGFVVAKLGLGKELFKLDDADKTTTRGKDERKSLAGKVKTFNGVKYVPYNDVLPFLKKGDVALGESLDEAYSGFLKNPPEPTPDSEPFNPTGAVAEFREDLRALFGKYKDELNNRKFIGGVAEIMVNWKSLLRSQMDEAEFRGKDVPLNKPKRGGSKAYYVYVRDPKTKKIKKVSFGSGGLRAKIKNKEARNAFAKRHNCKDKKDRTKAGYWSCNLPRYASALGLGANMNTFW